MIVGTVSGNLGHVHLKDAGGGQVLEFSVASTTKAKGEEETTWVKCSVWGERGAKIAEYVKQAKHVTACGPMRVRTYQKKDGGHGVSVEMRVNDLQWHGRKEQAAEGEQVSARPRPAQAELVGAADDDIPF